MSQAAAERTPTLFVDQFIYIAGLLHLTGWVHDPAHRIVGLEFRAGDVVLGHPRYGQPSPVAAGPNCGFELRLVLPDAGFLMHDPSLAVSYADGTHAVIERIGMTQSHAEPGHALYQTFLRRLRAMHPGHLLEIGSRARSGVTRHHELPADWRYTGMDILAGENVDVVGDAHQLSALLPHGRFDAVLSVAVWEHLAMPWKVATELNRVMAPGGIAFIFTHQTFPLHDEPWDYFRFSTSTWPALFNAKTGFRILEAAAAEPVFIVGRRWNPGVDHRLNPGDTVSAVLVEKTGETGLTWPVELSDVVATQYPG